MDNTLAEEQKTEQTIAPVQTLSFVLTFSSVCSDIELYIFPEAWNSGFRVQLV